MGLLDILGGIGKEHSGLATAVMEMLNNNQTGGLAGLAQSFQSNGLGNIVSSWISTGANLPISAEQIQSALGGDRIQQLAQSAGISAESVGSSLSTLLPTLVDRLTPTGSIQQSLVSEGLSLLKNRLS